jgi:hypothetical protein
VTVSEYDAAFAAENAGLGNERLSATAAIEELSYLFATFGEPRDVAASDAVPNRAYLHILHLQHMND